MDSDEAWRQQELCPTQGGLNACQFDFGELVGDPPTADIALVGVLPEQTTIQTRLTVEWRSERNPNPTFSICCQACLLLCLGRNALYVNINGLNVLNYQRKLSAYPKLRQKEAR